MKHLCQISLSHAESLEGHSEGSSGSLLDARDGDAHLLTSFIVKENVLLTMGSDLLHC